MLYPDIRAAWEAEIKTVSDLIDSFGRVFRQPRPDADQKSDRDTRRLATQRAHGWVDFAKAKVLDNMGSTSRAQEIMRGYLVESPR